MVFVQQRQADIDRWIRISTRAENREKGKETISAMQGHVDFKLA